MESKLEPVVDSELESESADQLFLQANFQSVAKECAVFIVRRAPPTACTRRCRAAALGPPQPMTAPDQQTLEDSSQQ